jgi:hypothetical protein
MSVQAQFDKAVQIVKNLPKEGPVQPTQEDQLKVSEGQQPMMLTTVLRTLQAGYRW